MVRSPTPPGDGGGAGRAGAPPAGSGPVPGWGAPLLPARRTDAPQPDLGRLSEAVAGRLARQAVAARERRGEV